MGLDGKTAPVYQTASILSIGDELTLGQSLDTNAQWLSGELMQRGIRVLEHSTIPDDAEAIAQAMARLGARADVVVATGGLGPTADDLTREALSSLLGEPLIEDLDLVRWLTELLSRRGRTLSPNQLLQTRRPPSARPLENGNGTAPGLHARVARRPRGAFDVFCLPGPPNEMMPMFRGQVLPLMRTADGDVIRTRLLHTFGLPEADTAARLGELMDRSRNPLVGTTASGGIITCRIRYEGPAGDADMLMQETEAEVRARLGAFLFGADRQTLPGAVLERLRGRSEMLLTVESCTGGLVGSWLTAIPGSSEAYLGGWVTYANAMKMAEVGVPETMLEAHGAVSEPVARAMVEGALAGPIGGRAQHALSITGIAGPDGGNEVKPVGTVFIGRAARSTGGGEVEVRRFLIPGDREEIRRRSATLALGMLRLHLDGVEQGTLLWQVEPGHRSTIGSVD